VYLQAAKQIKISARREKCQISTSECRENACIFFTERGGDSTKLNLFEYLLFPFGYFSLGLRPKGSEVLSNLKHRCGHCLVAANTFALN
jgi:hypothetical protein